MNRRQFIYFAVSILVWISLWFVPWMPWMPSKWLRLLIGLLMIALPGFLASFFVLKNEFDLPFHGLVGFLMSVACVEILAFTGRLFNLPFAYITPMFVLLGCVLLFIFFKRNISLPPLQMKNYSWFSVGVLVASIIVGVLFNFQSRFSGDNFTYLAELTNAQHSSSLNFTDQIFGTGQPQPIRFWMAMLPYMWAFVAKTTAIHGLWLLGYYLQPVLIILAVFALYFLNKHFLKSDYKAAVSVFFQITFFMLLRDTQQPGSIFFSRLSEDKAFAAFVQFPVLMICADYFRKKYTFAGGLFFALLGWGMALTHPVISFFAVFIVVVYFFVREFLFGEYRKFAVLASVSVVIMLLVTPLRFIEAPTAPTSYDLEAALETDPSIVHTRIIALEGTPFYGFNPDRIQIRPDSARTSIVYFLLSRSYLWIVLLGFLWSILNWKKNYAAPFVFASALLVLLSLFPFTGWLVGKFVTARMLWRTPWMLPIGLFVFTLVEAGSGFLLNKFRLGLKIQNLALNFCMVLFFAAGIYFSAKVYESRWKNVWSISQYKVTLANLVNLGNDLDAEVDQPSIFISDKGLFNYLPGISYKSDTAFFRTKRVTAVIVSDGISVKVMTALLSSNPDYNVHVRMSFLSKHRIRYILTSSKDVGKYYESYPNLFYVKRIRNYWLIEIRPLE